MKKKPLTVAEFAAMGGKARAQKLSKQQLSEIGKKGGRPKKQKAEPCGTTF
jgi:general stress protein YciG